VCWAPTEAEGSKIAFEQWANTGLIGELNQELATPKLIEQAATLVSQADVTKDIVCGPDPEKHLQKIQKFIDMGYDHVYIHQIGPHQAEFFQFYEKNILPKLL
jgi:hypothetical protein